MAAEDPSSAETARMGEGGVGTLRIVLAWGWVQPGSPAEYDWRHYDEVIGDAARYGIRVLPTIYGSPSWAAVRQNYPPWGQGNVEAFRAFASAAARRYGADGTFWVTHPEIPRLPVIWWQLWNEVSSSNFWDATPKAREYIDLVRVFREGIKEGDASAKILLAGLFPTPIAPNSIPFRRYLRALYKGGAKPLFDGAALHPYSTTPQLVLPGGHLSRAGRGPEAAQYRRRGLVLVSRHQGMGLVQQLRAAHHPSRAKALLDGVPQPDSVKGLAETARHGRQDDDGVRVRG
jgi:hypothetical protein